MAINKFVSFFNTSELSLKLPVTGFSSFAYLLQHGKKFRGMIDVEPAY